MALTEEYKEVKFWEGSKEAYDDIPIKDIHSGKIYFVTKESNNVDNPTFKKEIFLGNIPMLQNYNLPPEYEEYLSNVTYKKPDISIFNVENWQGGYYEPGNDTLNTDFILRYSLSNINNIKDNKLYVALSNGSEDSFSIPDNPTDYNKTIQYGDIILDNDTPVSYYISMYLYDTKNNKISKYSPNITFRRPILYGTATDLSDLIYNKFKSLNQYNFNTSFMQYEYNIKSDIDNSYIWFCSPAEYNNDLRTMNVTSGGFSVPVSSNEYNIDITNDYGITSTYKCYRTFEKVNASITPFKIKVSNGGN